MLKVCKILETKELVVNHCYDWTYFSTIFPPVEERDTILRLWILSLPLVIIAWVSSISVVGWMRMRDGGMNAVDVYLIVYIHLCIGGRACGLNGTRARTRATFGEETL